MTFSGSVSRRFFRSLVQVVSLTALHYASEWEPLGSCSASYGFRPISIAIDPLHALHDSGSQRHAVGPLHGRAATFRFIQESERPTALETESNTNEGVDCVDRRVRRILRSLDDRISCLGSG